MSKEGFFAPVHENNIQVENVRTTDTGESSVANANAFNSKVSIPVENNDSNHPFEGYAGSLTEKSDDDHPKSVGQIVEIFFSILKGSFRLNERNIVFLTGISLFLCLTACTIIACMVNFYRASPLLGIYCIFVIYKLCSITKEMHGRRIAEFFEPSCGLMMEKKRVIIRFLIGIGFLLVLIWIAFKTLKVVAHLSSLVGYFVIMFFIFISSVHPDKIKWRPVVLGCSLQIIIAVIILQTTTGFYFFSWLGYQAEIFLGYVEAGSDFVFGSESFRNFFAFRVLSLIIYFSSFISILYYLGVMQWLILKISWLMQISLKTSATETMVAVGNIFVGQTESPLLIRPYIDDLTSSELHAIMVSGFGTIAGSVLGAYLGIGIHPVYIITACFMAAPCALAVSKLSYPETEESKFASYHQLHLEAAKERNIIEAAFAGASEAIPLVLNIGANLIAFISLFEALNGVLLWFGSLFGYPKFSFKFIFSYLFLPVAFVMGIETHFCLKAAELLGIKVFLNEFVAYQSLSEILKMRDNGTVPLVNPSTGEINWLDERTEAIITYALCGFANFSSIGIMLGGLGAISPKRIGDTSRLILRALIGGFFVSILNACIAGFLYTPRPIACHLLLSHHHWVNAEPVRLLDCCSTMLLINPSSTTSCHCCRFPWNQTNYLLKCDNDAICFNPDHN